MAHAVWGTRAALRKEPAWHGLGTVFQEELTATRALELAGLDYQVEKCPTFVDFAGAKVLVPDQYAITRMPTAEDLAPKIFGITGERYQVLDNRRIAEILDPISERFPVESCAALHDGAVVFFSLRDAETSDVAGDEIVNYFVLMDTKDAKTKARMLYTPVRVVCQNTLTTGIDRSSINIEFPHTKDAAADIEFYSRFTLELRKTQDRTLDLFRRMTEVKVDQRTAQDVFASAFPVPVKPKRVELAEAYNLDVLVQQGLVGAKDQQTRAATARLAWQQQTEFMLSVQKLAVEALEQFNDEFPRNAGTAWAVYNASVEATDWRKGRGDQREAILIGQKRDEKVRAYNAIVELL